MSSPPGASTPPTEQEITNYSLPRPYEDSPESNPTPSTLPPSMPAAARLQSREMTSSKASAAHHTDSLPVSNSNSANSIHYAPSVRSSAASSGKASLVSGQVDIEVKQGARLRKSKSSLSTHISRDMVPELNKGPVKEQSYQSLRNAFDWRFFLTLINPIEYFWPLTFRRVGFWLLYGGIGVGLYYLNLYYSWAAGMSWAFRYQSLIAMGLIYGLEPLVMLLLYLIARLPDANQHVIPSMCTRCLTDLEDGIITPSNTETTALVIPCHGTELDSFFNVLKGAFKHFKPEQIFVIENGNSPTPPNNDLRDFCRRIHPDIQYIWSPIASKNAAQYVGTLAACSYDYIMTTDDDVVLPWNYRSPTEKITENTRAVCFPIAAKASAQDAWAGADSLVVSWQDIEFKASGLIKTAEDQLCSVLYPHGACSFWERSTFIDVLRIHSLVFYGEDTQMGFAMQKLGKMISIDASIVLETEVPASFLGPPLNYWQQRVRSWEMGHMSMVFKFLNSLFHVNGQRTITGFVFQKILGFYAIYSIACNLIRVPLFVIMYNRPGFWTKFALFSLAPILPPLFYKFVKTRHRPDLEPALIPVLTFPIYKFIFQIVSCLGAIRCIFYYWPSKRHVKTIKEWEKEGVFWQDERFLEDPGFLARAEGEEKGSSRSNEGQNVSEKEKAGDDEEKDDVANLADASYFDTRSRPSRVLSVTNRSHLSAAGSHASIHCGGGDDSPSAHQAIDKQRRMEQQMFRLETSVKRVEVMLAEMSRRL